MWSKKFSDTSVDLYSSTAKNVSPKKYWGSVRVVKYEKKINRKNKLGDYLVATDENNETVAFSAKEFNIAVWGMNDFTQEVARLTAEEKLPLICKYLSLLISSEGFLFDCLRRFLLFARAVLSCSGCASPARVEHRDHISSRLMTVST